MGRVDKWALAMGEARRRRLAEQSGMVTGRDFVTGEVSRVRFAGSPTDLLQRRQELNARSSSGERVDASVPCNGCKSCCHHEDVEVRAEQERAEDLRYLDLVQTQEGRTVLRKRDDGACAHLVSSGCAVYDHRPRACRMYDCRIRAIAGLTMRYGETEHTAPAWAFRPQSPQDLATMSVLRISARRYLAEHPNGLIEDTWDYAVAQLNKAMVTFSISSEAEALGVIKALENGPL